MLTLRAIFKTERAKSAYSGEIWQYPATTLRHPDDSESISARKCPRCQQCLTAYRFTTRDGLSIVTYHCTEHGDVIPRRGATPPDCS